MIFFTLRFKLTYSSSGGRLFTTFIDYCSPNQNIVLLSVIAEPQFAMAVDKAREQAGFPYDCYLCLVS